MKVMRMYPSSINERYLEEICEALKDGGIIIYPTDTLYALGCDALNNQAVERLCKLHGVNPQKQTLSIVCDDISMASEYARIDNEAYTILKRNLPGPFTFILPASNTLPKIFKGRKEVGIRIPDNEIALAISRSLCGPILTASLKIDESVPEMSPHELAELFASKVDVLIDDGSEIISPEPSTVVDITESRAPEIVREGKGQLS